MQQRLAQGETVVVGLRPGRDAKSFLVAAALAFASPLFALVGLAWNRPGLGVVLAWAAMLALALAVVTVGLARTVFVFEPDRLVERPFLRPTRVIPLSELASVRVVNAYTGRSLETHVQTFFLDPDGRARARIKGLHWGDRLALRASAAYGLPINRVAEPLTRSELRRRFRRDINPLERHPFVWALAQGLVVVGVGLPLLGTLTDAVRR